ncbi:hypothetical protein ACIBHX_38325 [Nonomuraea sp. NPDC050536]|uniref:hypothetical protein n=1 Tax=Nonomuraea sp. NPDC050536 TaxID=3364366 RepID=UPI0037C7C018
MALYYERRQAETTYFSIKATMRPCLRTIPGIEQEVYALLVTYQALIRAAADIAFTRTGLDMDRISFAVCSRARATPSSPLQGSSPTTR